MTFDTIDKAAARHAGEAGLSEAVIPEASSMAASANESSRFFGFFDDGETPYAMTGGKTPEADDDNDGDVEDDGDTDEDADDELSDDQSSDDGSAMMDAGSDTETGYFDFFGLPRELRAMVYEQDCLWEHELLPMEDDTSPVTKVVKFRLSMLLVNHQMHDEYKMQCEGQQTLRMRDHCEFGPYEAEPYRKRQVGLWELDMGAIDSKLDEAIRELDRLSYFLSKWVPIMDQLRSIRIKLYVNNLWREPANFDAVRSALSNIQKVDKLKSLEIYAIGKWMRYKRQSEPRTLLAHWTSGDDLHIKTLTTSVESGGTGSDWEGINETSCAGYDDDIESESSDAEGDIVTSSDPDASENDESSSARSVADTDNDA